MVINVEENYKASKVLLENELYNACLHNAQQCIEKALKSLFIEKAIPFKKTHNILELKTTLEKHSIIIDLSEDECDFIDSIYLPAKYPVGSALPLFYPDKEICESSITLTDRVLKDVNNLLK